MQSTRVYWIPIYGTLEERGFHVYLVNARHTKILPGRKSDVQESRWLLKLHTYGLLNNSFQPHSQIRVLRTYWRQRGEHVQGAATCIQRMQKALTQMNVQMANVISDVSGLTRQAIIRAMVAGERDPQKLAELSDPRIHASREEVAKPGGQLAPRSVVCIAAGSRNVRYLSAADHRVRSAIAEAPGEFRGYGSVPADRSGTQEKENKTGQERPAI